MQSPCADELVVCPPTQRAFFRFGRDVLLPNVDETAQVSDLIVRSAQCQGSTRAVEDGRFLVGYCGGFTVGGFIMNFHGICMGLFMGII
jgi:hypothetical protein